MAELKLRPYQEKVVADIENAWAEGDSRVIAWLPTGSGKTELACALALTEEGRGGHTVFVVERKTLCTQGAARFQKYGMTAGILRGTDTILRGYEPVTVASIQSIRSRKEHAQVDRVLSRTTQIIVDEAHVLFEEHDRLFERLPDARVVGLTATPLRDGLGLRYDRLVRGPSYSWLIEHGYLVKPRYFMPSPESIKTALQSVPVASTGDYAPGELAKAMRDKTLIGDVVGTWQAKAENRRALVFCVDIAHSKDVCDEFNAAGVAAEHIDYKTPDDDRAAIFQRFRCGETRVLCSVTALALGFDEPAASCLILARPTLSTSLHIQQGGRGLRPFEGKRDCLIFDHALNVVRHDRLEHFEPPELSLINKRSDTKRRSDPVFDYRPCPECSAIMAPRQRECAECGHVIRKKHIVDWVDGDLDEAGKWTKPRMGDQDFYRELLWIARARRLKPGWAYYKYREKFPKQTPPYRWRDLEPLTPTDETRRWLTSRSIAWRKAQEANRSSANSSRTRPPFNAGHHPDPSDPRS